MMLNDSIFDDLYTFLKQAESIAKGGLSPANVIRIEVADVKAIRQKLDVSQKEMAVAFFVSVDTVKSWEQKRRNPTGLARKVLCLLDKDPELFSKFVTVKWHS